MIQVKATKKSRNEILWGLGGTPPPAPLHTEDECPQPENTTAAVPSTPQPAVTRPTPGSVASASVVAFTPPSSKLFRCRPSSAEEARAAEQLTADIDKFNFPAPSPTRKRALQIPRSTPKKPRSEYGLDIFSKVCSLTL